MRKYAYRELSRADRLDFENGLPLAPRGDNSTYAAHLVGSMTEFISASESIAGTLRYVDTIGSHGLARIEIATARNGGARYVSNSVLLRRLEAQGHWYLLDMVKRDREALFVGPIARRAVRLINRPRQTLGAGP